MVPELCFKKGLSDLASNGCRKALQILSAGAHKNRGLDRTE